MLPIALRRLFGPIYGVFDRWPTHQINPHFFLFEKSLLKSLLWPTAIEDRDRAFIHLEDRAIYRLEFGALGGLPTSTMKVTNVEEAFKAVYGKHADAFLSREDPFGHRYLKYLDPNRPDGERAARFAGAPSWMD